MAQYTVTYSCGHTISKQLSGPMSSRSNYMAWAAKSGCCNACVSSSAEAELDDFDAQHGLPTLTGSDKQVSWARKIRKSKVDGVLEMIESLRAKEVEAGRAEEAEKSITRMLTVVFSNTTARYWIDAKDTHPQTMLREAYSKVKDAA